jgi:hypothetical protein
MRLAEDGHAGGQSRALPGTDATMGLRARASHTEGAGLRTHAGPTGQPSGTRLGPAPVSGPTLRPTRLAHPLGLRVALEPSAAAEALNPAGAPRPPIDGMERCLAFQVRHLSLLEDSVGTQDYRARADGAHRTGRGHESAPSGMPRLSHALEACNARSDTPCSVSSNNQCRQTAGPAPG